MHSVWDSGRRFRAFVDYGAARATVVGDRIDDDAIGQRFGRVLVVTDREGEVLDVEIDISGSADLARDWHPSDPLGAKVASVVAAEIEGRDATAASIGDWIAVAFEDESRGVWTRLARSGVFLQVAGDRLTGLAIQQPEVDPGGTKEAALGMMI
jgi:hypothetical protein